MRSYLILILAVAPPLNAFIAKRQAEAEEPACECVPYFQCLDGKIITTGEGILDPRQQTCSGVVEVCCQPPDDGGTNPNPPIDPVDPNPVDPFPVDPNPVDPNPVDPFPVDPNPVDPNPVDPDPSIPNNPDFPFPTIASGEGCGLRRFPGGSDNFQSNPNSAIVESFYGEAPWMVKFIKENQGDGEKQYMCGGTLVTPTTVLTAAHCVPEGTIDNIIARVGEYKTSTSDEPIKHQDKRITRIKVHPEYNADSLANDVALVGLDSPVRLSRTIDVICTPEEAKVVDANECFAYGWGKSDAERFQDYQDTMKKIKLPIITREDCQTRLRTTKVGKYFKLHPGFLCAGGDVGSDTCEGDGGGPLVCPLRDDPNRLVQVGIIAWGIECGKGNPAVFVSVQNYMKWIRDQIR